MGIMTSYCIPDFTSTLLGSSQQKARKRLTQMLQARSIIVVVIVITVMVETNLLCSKIAILFSCSDMEGNFLEKSQNEQIM